jgi:hypothetical protein
MSSPDHYRLGVRSSANMAVALALQGNMTLQKRDLRARLLLRKQTN